MENKKEKAEEAVGFLTGIFTGWGIPANWAKAIAGAIVGAVIGALIAVGALSTTSCNHGSITDEQIEAIYALHDAYHLATGEPCTIAEFKK
jgi:hypothetical protein